MPDQTTRPVRYRKKPIEVDTVQWTGDNEAEVQEFAGGARYFLADVKANPASDEPQATAVVYDRLHATWINVYTGQHIVRGVQGEVYPIAEEVLAETYERVDAAAPLPVSEARTRLLQALDASYCQALGHTPEGLLAAYEASRTQTVGRAALRETVAGVLAAHDWLYFSRGRRYAAADAILAAVLPATTSHDTDTGAGPVCKDAEGCHRVVPCEPGCGTRDLLAEATRPMPAPVDRAAVLREVERHVRDLAQATFQPYYRSAYATLADDISRMADETAATETQPADLPTLAAALDGFATLLATSSRDWGVYRVDAWLYAVILGWDCEQDEHDDTCVHGALEEMAEQHGWDDATVAKARRYRAAVRTLVEAHQPAGARQDGAQ